MNSTLNRNWWEHKIKCNPLTFIGRLKLHSSMFEMFNAVVINSGVFLSDLHVFEIIREALFFGTFLGTFFRVRGHSRSTEEGNGILMPPPI